MHCAHVVIDLLAGLPDPAPDVVAAARAAAGLSQSQAAALAGLGAGARWAEYERSGVSARRIDLARWALFLLATGQHPGFRAVRGTA